MVSKQKQSKMRTWRVSSQTFPPHGQYPTPGLYALNLWDTKRDRQTDRQKTRKKRGRLDFTEFLLTFLVVKKVMKAMQMQNSKCHILRPVQWPPGGCSKAFHPRSAEITANSFLHTWRIDQSINQSINRFRLYADNRLLRSLTIRLQTSVISLKYLMLGRNASCISREEIQGRWSQNTKITKEKERFNV